MTKTDNPKDVAINGAGFFQVLMPDGTTSYTRDGSFQTDRDGQLVTASGFHDPAADHDPAERHQHHGRPRRHRLGDAGRQHRARCRSASCSWPPS